LSHHWQAGLPIDLPLDALADIETAGVSLAKNWQSIVLTIRMCFSSIESAEDVETLISLVIMMAGAQPDVPEEALELLEAVDVSIDGSCLDISFEMTMSQIVDLIESAAEEESPW